MLPTVSVEVAEPHHEYAAAMIEACTAALRRGRCELEAEGGEPPSAVAVVSWIGDDRMGALVEVGEAATTDRWARRSIEFVAADPERERWRAVGITVAALVGDLATAAGSDESQALESETEAPDSGSKPLDDTTTETPEASTHPPDHSRRIEPQVAAPGETSTRARGWMAGGVMTSLDPSAWRAGVWVRGALIPIRSVFVTAAGTFVGSPTADDVALAWERGSAGGGISWQAGSVELAGHVEAVIERVTASYDGSGPRVSDSKVLGGARLGVGATWPAARPLALTGGLELDRRSRSVQVLLDDDVVDFPATTYAALVGLRWTP